jgi:uncharacterized SAM-binding protein YcdF (DUF218 family)
LLEGRIPISGSATLTSPDPYDSVAGAMKSTLSADRRLSPTQMEEASLLSGLLVRRYRWGLSLQAKLLLTVTIVVFALITSSRVYPFLAVTQRVHADVLVVEGWVHEYAVEASVEEFNSHHYRQVFATGGPVVGKGGYINDYQTSASVGADALKKAGIPTELIEMVPSHVMGRDRTYSSAIALRDWFRKRNLSVPNINIVTEGAHARRTRLLFQKALGPSVAVGVIAVPSPDFDAKRWWYYSQGVEEVVDQALGYLYGLFFVQADKVIASERRTDLHTASAMHSWARTCSLSRNCPSDAV